MIATKISQSLKTVLRTVLAMNLLSLGIKKGKITSTFPWPSPNDNQLYALFYLEKGVHTHPKTDKIWGKKYQVREI